MQVAHDEDDANVAINAENSALIENHRAYGLLSRSDKVGRGKAAGLIVEEISFSSKDRGMGCYGESAKEKRVDLEN